MNKLAGERKERILPIVWQGLALLLAVPCHTVGNTLPHGWQALAMPLAKLCHFIGKDKFLI